ncbi:MAG: PQQ-like beta-propeller repeat protein [Bacteroidales bacterium]|jgi:outer membrane protein assembly factor BamB|nr:PQQ-like beta-propeller repeat protein [Bacteroidales bacterium]
MQTAISRNIAIVSAIFIVAFSIMLVTNYVQVSGVNTLQSDVIENLKLSFEENGDNPQLQEQIRQLDLLARKAYFISMGRLKIGIAILLMSVIIFVICIRIYFAKSKDIPDKDIDPIDDWLIKSKARTYIIWIASGMAVCGILFTVLTSPYLKNLNEEKTTPNEETEVVVSDNLETISEDEILSDTILETSELIDTVAISDTIEISKITHNAFRGNNSLGLSSAKNSPTSWDLSSGKNILWKLKIPRKGKNSPIINGNKVFFSGADETARELFCYELSSGKLLWKLSVKNTENLPKTTDDTGLASSTVATNGKQVCAIFATGDVLCADMDGKQLWAKNIGTPDNPYGYASSLLTFGNSLIIQYDNRNAKKVIALDLVTGSQRWAKDRAEKSPSWTSPIITTVNGKPQLMLIGNPGITAYNPNNGELLWRTECMSGEPAPSPAYANGVLFAATEYATMTAINATDGTILWQNDEFLPEISSPVATKDFVFIATTYGTVASFNAQTGELIKSMELNTEFNSSPIIVEGKIYLTCTNGKVHIFSAKGDFTLISSFDAGEKTFATPAFTDKKMVVKTDDYLYCVENR